jgi:hypothetical protein
LCHLDRYPPFVAAVLANPIPPAELTDDDQDVAEIGIQLARRIRSDADMKLFILILFVILTVDLWIRGARSIRRSRGRPATCGRCGCPVSGLIGREIACPECGFEFEEVGITPAMEPSVSARWMGIILVALPFAIWSLVVAFILAALGWWP